MSLRSRSGAVVSASSAQPQGRRLALSFVCSLGSMPLLVTFWTGPVWRLFPNHAVGCLAACLMLVVAFAAALKVVRTTERSPVFVVGLVAACLAVVLAYILTSLVIGLYASGA